MVFPFQNGPYYADLFNAGPLAKIRSINAGDKRYPCVFGSVLLLGGLGLYTDEQYKILYFLKRMILLVKHLTIVVYA